MQRFSTVTDQESQPQQQEPQQNLEPEVRLMDELFKFMRTSTGLAISLGYLLLLLASMIYMQVLYSSFDINIFKFLTLEDILATPIKNPFITVAFVIILFFTMLVDFGNRYRTKQQKKYAGSKMPWGVKLLYMFFWSPYDRGRKILRLAIVIILILLMYIVGFASKEAENITDGEGVRVRLVLADDSWSETTLIGTSTNYAFTYDHIAEASAIFYVESIKLLKPLKLTGKEAKAIEVERSITESARPSEPKQQPLPTDT